MLIMDGGDQKTQVFSKLYFFSKLHQDLEALHALKRLSEKDNKIFG